MMNLKGERGQKLIYLNILVVLKYIVFTKSVCSCSLHLILGTFTQLTVLYKGLVKTFFAIYFFQFHCSSLGKKSTDKRGSTWRFINSTFQTNAKFFINGLGPLISSNPLISESNKKWKSNLKIN